MLQNAAAFRDLTDGKKRLKIEVFTDLLIYCTFFRKLSLCACATCGFLEHHEKCRHRLYGAINKKAPLDGQARLHFRKFYRRARLFSGLYQIFSILPITLQEIRNHKAELKSLIGIQARITMSVIAVR